MNIEAPVTTTYVRYFRPGLFVSEESVQEVGERDPQRAAREAPASAFAFRFFDRVTATADVGGEELELRSRDVHCTGRYYIDAEQMSRADVEALPDDHRILLANMRANGWDPILRCRTGNWQPLKPGDVLVSTDEKG